MTCWLPLVQVSPQLEESSLLTVGAALSGMTPTALEAAHAHWLKADSYYYMSIARMQRLWEVNASAGVLQIRVLLLPYLALFDLLAI